MEWSVAWIVNPRATYLHVAEALAAGRALIDVDRFAPLAEAATQLNRSLAAVEVDLPAAWRGLIHQAAETPESPEIGARVGQSAASHVAFGDERQRDLSVAIHEYLSLAESRLPDAERQVEMRLRPLREQWEARGPGLLKAAAAHSEGELAAEQQRVLPVFPVLGGFGDVHFPFSSVRLEALLANPNTRLPEVVRLGWLLITQALLRRQSPSTPLDATNCRAAAIPIVLAAAERVELVRGDASLTQLAAEIWLGTQANET